MLRAADLYATSFLTIKFVSESIKKNYLLVDGHSVIFHWPDLRQLHAREPAKCRSTLISLLRQLHDGGHWLVTLVFDGKSGPREAADPGSMVVLYSTAGQTADSIIERLTAQVPDPGRVFVITADQAERLTVESLGAYVFSPDWLRDEIERNHLEWRDLLTKVHRKAKW